MLLNGLETSLTLPYIPGLITSQSAMQTQVSIMLQSARYRAILINTLVSTYSYIDANGTFSYLLSYYLGAYVYGRNIDWPVKLWFDAIWDPTELGHRGGQNGDGFFVTSTSGVPTTYAREVTVVSTPHTSTSSATQVSSTSNSDSATSTPITVSSSQQNQSPSSTSATLPIASSGLSTGAKAGIAVGAVVGVIAIALFAWWFVRMQRQVNKLKNELALTQNALDPAASKPELAGKKVLGGDQAKTPVTTTNTVDRWELPSGATVAELGPERK